MSVEFRLITGRTREQAIGLHKGKASQPYLDATHQVEMSGEDMSRVGIDEGARVRLRTPAGSGEFVVREGDLPPGLLFVPMGAAANELIGADTAGTGMPSFKGQPVEVEPA